MALVLLLSMSVVAADAAVASVKADDIDAKWIWTDSATEDPFAFVRFRKRIQLDEEPGEAWATVTADTFYRLWINGKLAMHGPARSSEGEATMDRFAVTQHLQAGSNLIEAEVMFYDGRFEALGQSPGFLCAFDIATPAGRMTVGTDASWQASEDLRWSRQSPKFSYQRTFLEDYDADPDKAAAWKAARVIGGIGVEPWARVKLRDVPLPDPDRTVQPASVVSVQRGDGSHEELKGTPELESTRYGPRPVWCKRLQTEKISVDESAVQNAEAVLALASWSPQSAAVVLSVDWERLGIDPAHAVLRAPAVAGLQPPAVFSPEDPIQIEPGRGIFLIIESSAINLHSAVER